MASRAPHNSRSVNAFATTPDGPRADGHLDLHRAPATDGAPKPAAICRTARPADDACTQAPAPPAPLAYAELHCLTHFSFQRGASSPEELVQRAWALGYTALAITDECSVAGVVRAWQALGELERSAGAQQDDSVNGAALAALHAARAAQGVTAPMRLIYGSEFRFQPADDPGSSNTAGAPKGTTQAASADALAGTPHGTPWNEPGTLVVLARDLSGWGALCTFITRCRGAAAKGDYRLPPLAVALAALPGCELLWAPQRGTLAGSALNDRGVNTGGAGLPAGRAEEGASAPSAEPAMRRAAVAPGLHAAPPPRDHAALAASADRATSLTALAAPPPDMAGTPDALDTLDACDALDTPDSIAAGAHPPGARASFCYLSGLLVELHADADDALHLAALQRLSAATGLPLVAAGDVHMHVRARKRLQDVMTAIRIGRPVAQCGFALQPSGERHLRLRHRLADFYPPGALAATLAVAARCSFQLKEVKYNYPQEAVLPGLTAMQSLRRLTYEGAAERYPGGIPPAIVAFVEKELLLIAECQYEMFFLTVHDIVRAARRMGILCQGRGSAANSVVCWCLGITAADPEKSNPLLARFISKARRNEPPDIDVDFEHERREEVIQYIYRKYGRHRAALAATVISYRTRSALRDVGMALGIDAGLIDAVAKDHHWFDEAPPGRPKADAAPSGGSAPREAGERGGTPPTPGRPKSAATPSGGSAACEAGKRGGYELAAHRLADLAAKTGASISAAQAHLWLELTAQLKGAPRHLSQHVGGFVLTDTPLHRLVPVEPAAMTRDDDWEHTLGVLPDEAAAEDGGAELDAGRGDGAGGDGCAAHGVPAGLSASFPCAEAATGADDAGHWRRGAGPHPRPPPAGEGNGGQIAAGLAVATPPSSPLDPWLPAPPALRQVIQWDKDDLEALGMLKVDVLALGMLTAVRRCIDLVALRRGESFTRYDIQSEDPATYQMIRRADTVGTFQIESRAQMSMLPRLKPTTFYDLVVQVAIVRPGPITGGMVHPYLQARERRRRGLPIEYERSSHERLPCATDERGGQGHPPPGRPKAGAAPDPGEAGGPSPSWGSATGEAVQHGGHTPPRLAKALERTLGIPIFQEQVMELSMLAADFSADDADRLRRAMAAWKRKGGLGPFEEKLTQGMLKNGYSPEFAARIFRQIQGFGEYGFPESHAYSFALIAYESSWLKCHEPEAFLAAMLNSQPMGFYGPSQLIQDAQRHGVQVLPPDVSVSDWDCALERRPADEKAVDKSGSDHDFYESSRLVSPADKAQQAIKNKANSIARPAVRLGLRLVKGLSESAAQRITQARAQAPLGNVDDLARRAALGTKDLNQLAAADALASLAGHRRQQVWQSSAFKSEPHPFSPRRTHAADARASLASAGPAIGDDPHAPPLRDALPPEAGAQACQPPSFITQPLSPPPLKPQPATADPQALLRHAPINEAPLALPAAPEGEEIVHDYAALGLTLRRHPLALLRERLARRGVRTSAQLDQLPHGRYATACGLVIGRQQPGTAKGTIFVTLEDETGPINVIVWESLRMDEGQRNALLRAQLLAVQGEWQRDKDSGEGDMPPRFAASHAALPPEGTAADLGRPGVGGAPPRSPASRGALPPKGALAAFGRPGGGADVPPRSPASQGALPPKGALAAFGRPGGGEIAPPRFPASHGSLPPKGAAADLGRPGVDGAPPRSAGSHAALHPEGAAADLGRPGVGGVPPRSAASHAALLPDGSLAALEQAGSGEIVPPRSAASHAALPPEGAPAASGRVGSGQVRHLIAQRLYDLTPLLGRLAQHTTSRDFH